MKSLKDQRDRLAKRYQRAEATHSERSTIHKRMSDLVLKDLRGSIREERRKRAAR